MPDSPTDTRPRCATCGKDEAHPVHGGEPCSACGRSGYSVHIHHPFTPTGDSDARPTVEDTARIEARRTFELWQANTPVPPTGNAFRTWITGFDEGRAESAAALQEARDRTWPLVEYFRNENPYEGNRGDLDQVNEVESALRVMREQESTIAGLRERIAETERERDGFIEIARIVNSDLADGSLVPAASSAGLREQVAGLRARDGLTAALWAWDDARLDALALRLRRSDLAAQCELAGGDRYEARCWQGKPYGDTVLPIDEAEWCPACREAQGVHAKYRHAATVKAAALRRLRRELSKARTAAATRPVPASPDKEI